MKGKKILALVTAFSMLVAMVPQGLAAKAAETEYQIYPTPQSIEYESDAFTLDSKVTTIIEGGIDSATVYKLVDVYTSNGLEIETSAQVSEGSNLLMGIYGSEDMVDNYAAENVSFDEEVFSNYDAYVLDIDAEKETIVILGKDTDAVFYGLVSLMHILDQAENNELRDLTMEDYADTAIRGFIEGYYGIPWSNEDRMSLMEFGGQFKMTSYVFAPKDDPYHTTLWREEYPEEEINAIAEMVEVGNANKCRFVWTAHPFMGGFNSGDVEGEIDALLNKFEQLYSVGVRQFGVLGDDVGSLNKNIVIQVMNAVSEWAAEKGDVYDSVFCPAGYNHAWQGDYSELNTYDAGFPDDVQIFWTGEAVCQPIIQQTLNHFRNQNASNGSRRAPLFWLNWPVNDINGARLMMGKGSLLHTDINTEDLAGVVTNPMQEAEASKVAIFAVADYAWNVADFDDDQSWADSFAYIDADASEELHTLAKHMSNPQPNGHGLVLAESEELQPAIDTFEAKLAAGESLVTAGDVLIKEMDVIIAACDDFHTKSQNENLKEELLPFTGSLKDLATAIKNYIAAAIALEDNDGVAAFEYFSAASSAHSGSQKHVRQLISGSTYVSPGSTHLIPLADTIKEAIADEVTAFVFGSTESAVELTATSSFSSFYEGTVSNIIDGKENTCAWYGGYEAVGQYYQVNLSRPATLYGVEILNGTSSKPLDTFGVAEVQYTTDGTTWTTLEEVSTYQASVSVSDIAIENVTAVRYICTGQGSGNKWPSMREFTLDLTGSAAAVEIYTNTELPEEAEAITQGKYFALENVEEVTLEPGEYVGLKLDRIHELETAAIYTDRPAASLQVSENGTEWKACEDGMSVRYIRLYNDEEEAITFGLVQFVVSTVEFEEKSVEATNYTSFDGDFAALFDGDWTTAYQFANSQVAGKYLTIDLGQEINLNSFKAVCTDSEWDYPRHAKFSVSADGESWTEIMTMGSQDAANEGEAEGTDNINDVMPDHEISYNTKSVTDLDLQARYLKFEITRTKVGPDKWVRFQEFEINGGAYIPAVNDKTVEGPGEEINNRYAFMTDVDISTKYTFSGVVVYHQSEENVNTVKIVQDGISRAVVQVRLAGEEEYRTLGTLDKTICEFAIDGQIVEVKIASAEMTQTSITEMMFSYTEDVPELTPEPEVTPEATPEVKENVTEVFDDVYADWYVTYVQYVYDNALMTGIKGTNNFEPNANITKAQVAQVLYNMEGQPAVTDMKVFTKLNDVYAAEWYANAVAWAFNTGVVTGDLNTMKFNPNADVTREQLALMMYRYADFKGYDVTAESDLAGLANAENTSNWAADGVKWAVGAGLISGIDKGAVKDLAPQGNASRAQMAAILQRFCEADFVK